MVIGIFKAESVVKVKNNPFYGNYEVKSETTETIVNEKYVGLISPKNGIRLTIKTMDGEEVTFTIGKYFITGEEVNDGTETIWEDEEINPMEFSTSFSYKGHVYEISVDHLGQLVSFDEWYNLGDFEDGNEPDNHYTKRSKGIKWELVDI
jgi:hypothetical protein